MDPTPDISSPSSESYFPNPGSVTIIEDQGKKMKNYQRLKLEARANRAVDSKIESQRYASNMGLM
jgi:hypothetical protein